MADVLTMTFNASATSEAFTLGGKDVVGLVSPAAPAGTKLTFQTSYDGGLTYVDVAREDAVLEVTMVDGDVNLFDANLFSGCGTMMKAVSDASETAVFQLVTRDFQ